MTPVSMSVPKMKLSNIFQETTQIFGSRGSKTAECSLWTKRSGLPAQHSDPSNDGIIGQVLCQLDDKSSHGSIQVKKFIPLIGPDPKRHEKNWLPFMQGEELFVIYLCDPLTIYKVDKETGNLEVKLRKGTPCDFSRFRGSAPPVQCEDGYLMLIHEAIYSPQTYYMHRFAFLDSDFNITKLSKPFTFNQKEIEYCLGMTIDHTGDFCILPISIDDREAWICTVPLQIIHSMLEPVPTSH